VNVRNKKERNRETEKRVIERKREESDRMRMAGTKTKIAKREESDMSRESYFDDLVGSCGMSGKKTNCCVFVLAWY
jgi:hypothetical protein